MMVKLYDNFSEKNMRMSRDLEGTEVSPVIWGELYDLVGRFSKSLMAPSDYRGGNDVFDFQTKNRLEFEPCMVCISSQWLHECSQREGEMIAFTAFMGIKAISVKKKK
ncbi:unnamed protein product, partial [Staurois parvus]